MGAGVGAARKRAGIVVPEASEAGLAPWSGQIGAIHGERGRFRLTREFSCGRMMIENPVNGESHLIMTLFLKSDDTNSLAETTSRRPSIMQFTKKAVGGNGAVLMREFACVCARVRLTGLTSRSARETGLVV